MTRFLRGQTSETICQYMKSQSSLFILELFILRRYSRIIECFPMTSRRPYWCPKTMKQWPCWCPKPVLWEVNSFLMQTLSFVTIYLHRCWPVSENTLRPETHKGLKRVTLICLLCPMLVIIHFEKYHIWKEKKR